MSMQSLSHMSHVLSGQMQIGQGEQVLTALLGSCVGIGMISNAVVVIVKLLCRIQREGIADDFGVFDSPDAFYARHGSNLSGLKRWLYERVIRHRMNRNVARVRAASRQHVDQEAGHESQPRSRGHTALFGGRPQSQPE